MRGFKAEFRRNIIEKFGVEQANIYANMNEFLKPKYCAYFRMRCKAEKNDGRKCKRRSSMKFLSPSAWLDHKMTDPGDVSRYEITKKLGVPEWEIRMIEKKFFKLVKEIISREDALDYIYGGLSWRV